jgi:hypothetical protein
MCRNRHDKCNEILVVKMTHHNKNGLLYYFLHDNYENECLIKINSLLFVGVSGPLQGNVILPLKSVNVVLLLG